MKVMFRKKLPEGWSENVAFNQQYLIGQIFRVLTKEELKARNLSIEETSNPSNDVPYKTAYIISAKVDCDTSTEDYFRVEHSETPHFLEVPDESTTIR